MRYKINRPLSLTIILVLAGMIRAAGQGICSMVALYTSYQIKNLINQ